MRTVVNGSEVPHLWAHKAQPSARSGNGTFYFEGDTIYSYGSHFPIARHATTVDGKKCILFTTRDYSVTTQRHKSLASRAIPPNVPVFYTDNPRQNINDVLDEYHAEVDNEVAWFAEELTKARATEIVAHYKNYLHFCKQCGRLQEFLNDFRNIPVLPNEALVIAAVEKYEANAKKRSDSAYKAAETRRASRRLYWQQHDALLEKQRQERAAKMPELIAKWRAGESIGSSYEFPTMLRIKSEQVETSRGATFPLEHAVKALPVVLSLVRNGKTFERNGHQIRLGHYQIDRIDADGTLHAGCHVLCKEEIEHFAGLVEGYEKITS